MQKINALAIPFEGESESSSHANLSSETYLNHRVIHEISSLSDDQFNWIAQTIAATIFSRLGLKQAALVKSSIARLGKTRRLKHEAEVQAQLVNRAVLAGKGLFMTKNEEELFLTLANKVVFDQLKVSFSKSSLVLSEGVLFAVSSHEPLELLMRIVDEMRFKINLGHYPSHYVLQLHINGQTDANDSSLTFELREVSNGIKFSVKVLKLRERKIELKQLFKPSL